ncbi:MAG: 23S rRNA (adenine(2030)-N(6))-methyltransferase RlmJ [Hyphomicrobium sp.]
MNYRHAYHAGNFADVVKHVILARVLTYMKLKPQPFRVIDTHAGTGRYDLTGIEAGKTGEWKEGIARLVGAELPGEIAGLLAPYLDAVASVNMPGALTFYPGSPVIARHLMRASDFLAANELHPDDYDLLKSELRRVPNTNVLNLDAYVAIKALLPPLERRGVVLIDPPFEQADEFKSLKDALANGLQRFANGVYIVWYPVKDQAAANWFVSEIAALGCRKMLDVRLKIAEPFAGLGLTETGVLLLNPPHSLKVELERIVPFLVDRLGHDRGAGFSINEPVGAS